MRRRLFVMGNPQAGRGRIDVVDTVARALERIGAEVSRSRAADEAAALNEARHLVAAGEVDALVAAGGDGTIRLAAKAVAGTAVPLGVIPLGTGNVMAHEVDLPRDPQALARMLVAGPALRINTATANGELFLLMAGVGFDGRIIRALDHRLKGRIGKLAYVRPVLSALAAAEEPLRVEIDGRAVEAAWVVVANARRYGGAFVLAPGTSLLEPRLQAIAFHGRAKGQRIRELIALARGRLDRLVTLAPGTVSMTTCSRVRIDSRAPVPAQVDGDAFGVTPLVIEDGGPAVHLIMPLPGKAATPDR